MTLLYHSSWVIFRISWKYTPRVIATKGAARLWILLYFGSSTLYLLVLPNYMRREATDQQRV